MTIRQEVVQNISELREIIDAAEARYRQSLEIEDDYVAIEQLEMAVDLVPDYGEAWHALGERYMSLYLMDKAEKCFIESWRYGGGVDTFLCLAEICLQRESYKRANFFYDYVLRFEPDNLSALLGQAVVYRVEEKILRAHQIYCDVSELLLLKEKGNDIGEWLNKRRPEVNLCLVNEYCDYRDIE